MQVSVRVIPRSGRNILTWEAIEQANQNGQITARLTAPPVDGAANEALITLLADRLHLPKRAIRIVRGATSRQKMVEIDQLTLDELRTRLEV